MDFCLTEIISRKLIELQFYAEDFCVDDELSDVADAAAETLFDEFVAINENYHIHIQIYIYPTCHIILSSLSLYNQNR